MNNFAAAAVTDPHKVRPCNYQWIVALPYTNTS